MIRSQALCYLRIQTLVFDTKKLKQSSEGEKSEFFDPKNAFWTSMKKLSSYREACNLPFFKPLLVFLNKDPDSSIEDTASANHPEWTTASVAGFLPKQ